MLRLLALHPGPLMLMRTVPGRSCVSVAEDSIRRTLGRVVVEGEEKAGGVLLGLHHDGAFKTLSIRILDLS